MTSRRGSSAYKPKSRTKWEDAALLDQARRYRLVRSTDSIVLMCPKDENKREAPVDLSYLLAFPYLTEPFAQAIQEICKRKASSYATCLGLGSEPNTGFFAFLKEKSLNNIRLKQLSTSHIEEFKNWLDRVDKTGVAVYALQTRQHQMSYVRQVVQYLQRSDKWAPQLAADLDIRPRMWSGQQVSPKPAPIIHAEDYRKIYQACKKEIIEITGRVKAMRAVLQENLQHPAALASEPAERTIHRAHNRMPNPYKDLGVLLATLNHRYPRQILSCEWLKELNDRSLASAVQKRTITSFVACFYPSVRDLEPLTQVIHEP